MAFTRRKLDTENELYEYAVGALARRMRSIAELKRLLRQRVDAETEIGKTLVELVIRRLKDQGYLNDAKYAAVFSTLRRDNQKLGRRRVILDLKAKGIHSEIIDNTVQSTFAEVDEERQAREYLRRKRMERPQNRKEAAKIFRSLMRAGFGSKTIFTILRKWDIEDDLLDALENETNSNDTRR